MLKTTRRAVIVPWGAASGEEALEHLAQCNIDFVITDIKLPDTSGIELIAYTKQNFPDVPSMAVTGCCDINTAMRVLKTWCLRFRHKPFDLAAVQ
jgi:DNA-binding NtrC family response regulator